MSNKLYKIFNVICSVLIGISLLKAWLMPSIFANMGKDIQLNITFQITTIISLFISIMLTLKIFGKFKKIKLNNRNIIILFIIVLILILTFSFGCNKIVGDGIFSGFSLYAQQFNNYMEVYKGSNIFKKSLFYLINRFSFAESFALETLIFQNVIFAAMYIFDKKGFDKPVSKTNEKTILNDKQYKFAFVTLEIVYLFFSLWFWASPIFSYYDEIPFTSKYLDYSDGTLPLNIRENITDLFDSISAINLYIFWYIPLILAVITVIGFIMRKKAYCTTSFTDLEKKRINKTLTANVLLTIVSFVFMMIFPIIAVVIAPLT